MIQLLQYYIRGEELQYRSHGREGATEWFRASAPCWDFYNYEYRVKPAEPAVVYCIKDGDYFYRAYSSRSSAETAMAETCFNEGSRVIKFKEVMDDE